MQHCHFNILNRRAFLDRSLKAGVIAALSTLADIPFVMKRALAEGIGQPGPDGKIKKVLFIWLRGANDALNSVIPIEDAAYASNRPTLRILKDASSPNYYSVTGACDFPVSASDPASPDFDTFHYANAIRLGNGFAALHPSLKFLAPVYNQGDLALVHRTAYPKQSRSHFDSQRYWENGTPNNNLANDGIFYRTIIESGLANTAPLTGISIQSSLPLILRGSDAAMTNLGDPNRYALLGVPGDTNGLAKATLALNTANPYPFAPKKNRELLQLQYQNLSQTLDLFADMDFNESPNLKGQGNYYQDDVKTDGDTNWVPIDQNGNPVPGSDPTKGYFLFPTTNDKNGGWRRPDRSVDAGKYVVPTSLQSFFANLKAAALVLNKTNAIIAGTEYGGFDTHNNQGAVTGAHANLNRGIGWAMYALKKYFTRYADRADWQHVVVVTLSEFGRTTIENDSLGTDHAEAGVMFVAGGTVKGYGKPGSSTGVFNCHPNDPIGWVPGAGGSMFGVSNRYLSRTTDFRSVLGEVIRKHLGATQNQLNRIIPGYADPNERLLTGGASGVDGAQIRGEVGIL